MKDESEKNNAKSQSKNNKVKNWFKKISFKWLSLKKSTRAWIIASTCFILLAITCFFVAVHLSGYNIGEWFAKYYAYFVIVAIILILVIGSVLFYKYVKGDL